MFDTLTLGRTSHASIKIGNVTEQTTRMSATGPNNRRQSHPLMLGLTTEWLTEGLIVIAPSTLHQWRAPHR